VTVLPARDMETEPEATVLAALVTTACKSVRRAAELKYDQPPSNVWLSSPVFSVATPDVSVVCVNVL
jgi:hypothetical protein